MNPLEAIELPEKAICEFGAAPFAFRHRVFDLELFSTEALARLCDAVPRPWIANHDADRPIITPVGTHVQEDIPLGDVVRRLDQRCRWIVVRHLEHIAPYREALGEVVDRVSGTVVPAEGRMLHRGANVFIASPGAVVPVHLDRHHNFLLQMTGTKELTVGSFEDPTAESREVERDFAPRRAGSHHVPARQMQFQLGPGDGVYIPAYAFHWVSGGSDMSIAFSCAFRTERTERIELAHKFNAVLARAGLPRRPPTGSARDELKASVVRWRRRTRSGLVRSS
jgi:hypothetical protein